MTKPIILAPAGGFAAVTAAVRCGADAVYLGAKNFNARRNAENFDDLALPETVKFCHERGTKVFVTVNTLVTDGEMDALIEEADAIVETGADAVILQDPAVMRLSATGIRRCRATPPRRPPCTIWTARCICRISAARRSSSRAS